MPKGGGSLLDVFPAATLLGRLHDGAEPQRLVGAVSLHGTLSLLCSLGGLAALWTPCLWISPRKYDSLIQAQARELSHLRQVLREGRGVSRSLAQHLRDALRSFEDILRGTDIDYYLGQGFREQLAQGRQLAERLSNKLGTSKYLWWRALGLDTGHDGLGRDALMGSVKGWGYLVPCGLPAEAGLSCPALALFGDGQPGAWRH